MSAIGYLKVKATTSRARLPLEDVAISVVGDNGKLLALRLTDSSGNTDPIKVEVPNLSNSQTPDTGKPPFVAVDIYGRAEPYTQILVRDVQIFPDTTTVQELNMIPLSEMPGSWNETEIFDTPAQDL